LLTFGGFMIWICREKCYWRDVTHLPGETVEVGDKFKKWELNGGVWLPEDTTVVDPKDNKVIPWYFEPVDTSCLVDIKHLHLARSHKKTERTWKYISEIADEIDIPVESLPDPEPLTPEVFKKLKDDPDALVTIPKVRKRRQFKPKT
jgi:hypothetical protein